MHSTMPMADTVKYFMHDNVIFRSKLRDEIDIEPLALIYSRGLPYAEYDHIVHIYVKITIFNMSLSKTYLGFPYPGRIPRVIVNKQQQRYFCAKYFENNNFQ
jgi:hypothetical protein